MSLWDNFDCEMHPVALDTDTVDRLLAGAIAPADAPPGYSDVARLLRAVSAEAMPEELAGETETVGIVATVVRPSVRVSRALTFEPAVTRRFTASTLPACAASITSVCPSGSPASAVLILARESSSRPIRSPRPVRAASESGVTP